MKKMLMLGLSSNLGGVETCIFNTINSNKYKNIKIDFVNSSTKKLAFQDKLEKKYTIYKISNYYDYSDKYSEELKRIIIANNYDYIYINLCSSLHLEPVNIAYHYGKAKIIIHAHCIESNDNEIKKYLTSVGNILYACSEEAGNSFFLPNTYKVITPIIGNDFIEDDKKRNKMRNKFNLSNNIVLGQVGKFCDRKNQIFSIKLLEKLLHFNDKYKLILVGRKNKEIINYINKKNLNDYVIITDVISNVNDYLNIMDVFLFPSKSEAYGMALVEAQNYSKMLYIASTNVKKVTNVSGKVKYIELDIDKWAKEINKNFNL